MHNSFLKNAFFDFGIIQEVLYVSSIQLNFTSLTTNTITLQNASYNTINYQITKSDNWITNITNAEGELLAGMSKSVKITVDHDMMQLGDNSSYLDISSDIGDGRIRIYCTIEGDVETKYAEEDYTSVVLYGNIEGDFSYSEKGFYFGTDVNCTTKYSVSGSGSGTFSYYVSGLEEGAMYYYKAYIVRNDITIFGELKYFTTDAHTFIAEGCGPGGCDLIVNMGDLGECTWSQSNGLTNANSEVDGLINMEILKSIDPTLDQFPAAKVCNMKGEGWYLPSKTELHNILGSYKNKFDAGSFWSSTEADESNAYGCGIYKYSSGSTDHNNICSGNATGEKIKTLKVCAVKRAN